VTLRDTLGSTTELSLLTAGVDVLSQGVTSPEQLAAFLGYTAQILKMMVEASSNHHLDSGLTQSEQLPQPAQLDLVKDYMGHIAQISLSASASPGCGSSTSSYQHPWRDERIRAQDAAERLRRTLATLLPSPSTHPFLDPITTAIPTHWPHFDVATDAITASLAILAHHASPVLGCAELITWAQSGQISLDILAVATCVRIDHDNRLANLAPGLTTAVGTPVTIREALAAQGGPYELLGAMAQGWTGTPSDLAAAAMMLAES
jgi:hypothetical protein